MLVSRSLQIPCFVIIVAPVLRAVFRVLALWKNNVKQTNEKAAEALADPAKYPNLFPELDWALKVRSHLHSASLFSVGANYLGAVGV